MKKRSAKSTVRLKTGNHCSQSGWWRLEQAGSVPHFISEGSIMPAVAGTQVTWLLILPEAPRGLFDSREV